MQVRWFLSRAALAATVLLFPAVQAVAQQGGVTSSGGVVAAVGSPGLAETARSLSSGDSMRLEGLTLKGEGRVVGLDLVRFDVLSRGAVLVVQEEGGPREVKVDVPTYLRGSVDGMAGSVAVLAVRGDGEVRGVVASADGTWIVGSEGAASHALRSGKLDRAAMAKARKFECETAPNPNPPRQRASGEGRHPRLPIAYTAQVAVVLDFDYFSTFAPDTGAAILYALDLMAFTGVLGEAELGMNVQVPYLELWTTSTDPFSGGSGTRLGQVRSRWNQPGGTRCGGIDCTTIPRTTVLLLSSASTGGVAYLPGICDWWHSPTGGASYAYAGSIDGDFDIDAPSAVWDITVTTHELGHNLGSDHTHCYDPPVDGCYNGESGSGCYAGAEALPPGCPGNGQGCGTIMSYCHLLSGGIGNIALSFGAGHAWGTDPDRVPDRMIDQLGIEFAAAPNCLTPTDGLFELEIAKAGTGSGVVTASVPGIDCGTACRTWANADDVVTLTATPGTFSAFSGWSGDPDCSDGVVTMTAARSCIATFDGTCGAGNEDCDDGDPCTQDSCPMDLACENSSAPRDPMTCHQAGKTRLQIADSATPESDKMIWQWAKGAAFVHGDLGSPDASTTYSLCVYDGLGGSPALATTLEIAPNGTRWKNKDPKGWNYKDSAGASAGVKKMLLKPGPAGKTKIKLVAGGTSLPLPGAFSGSEYFDQDPSVVVQLLGEGGACWTSTFEPAGTKTNAPSGFKASGN
jgi:hypothetical protein